MLPLPEEVFKENIFRDVRGGRLLSKRYHEQYMRDEYNRCDKYPEIKEIYIDLGESGFGSIVVFTNEFMSRLTKHYDPDDVMFGDTVYTEDYYDGAYYHFNDDEGVVGYSDDPSDMNASNIIELVEEQDYYMFDVDTLARYYFKMDCPKSIIKTKLTNIILENKYPFGDDRLMNFLFWYENLKSISDPNEFDEPEPITYSNGRFIVSFEYDIKFIVDGKGFASSYRKKILEWIDEL